MKRKRSEDEAGPSAAAPSGSLVSLSVSKLHRSLQHVEPNLRHLVLVANTLRRIQDEMLQPATAPIPHPDFLADGGCTVPRDDAVGALACTLQDTCQRPVPPSSLGPPVEELLLSNMDSSVFSTILEDLSGFGDLVHPSVAQPEGGQLCLLSPEPERTSHPRPSSPLEILGPGTYLLEDGLEGVFEDIDTSMYDYDLWSTSLPTLKEAFPSTEDERPGLGDLDYLMDMLVEAQEL
ncbi:SERTA domain-containing protein 1 [Rhineura floridana]|uniref:SERTA domain-containing protein 1 n=1 Tax=Rhineura floridana TaxID=261503 RepID=UPI002AC83B93|nr:SERTA domain-containing protein 1 [Rhineura floridana]XP_061452557.1 SERTA domain-containing protein 1 [Rhineura floridana]